MKVENSNINLKKTELLLGTDRILFKKKSYYTSSFPLVQFSIHHTSLSIKCDRLKNSTVAYITLLH